MNPIFRTEKIKYLGVKDQVHTGECWVYSLSLLICLTNARKYGRKIENFNEIYNNIIANYYKNGKTDIEIDIIMKDIFVSVLKELYIKKQHLNMRPSCMTMHQQIILHV